MTTLFKFLPESVLNKKIEKQLFRFQNIYSGIVHQKVWLL